jgi:hypothetical protein
VIAGNAALLPDYSTAKKKSWFFPATRNDVPVACLALLPVRFELQPAL